VRFASIYRSFQDVDAFRHEIERLHTRRRRPASLDQLSLLSGGAPEGSPASTPSIPPKAKP
jgi:transcriptional repressor NrdR